VKGQDYSDDAVIAEAAGLDVVLTPGDWRNDKITQADDLDRARSWVNTYTGNSVNWEFRTGSGYDVHRFEPGDHCWLCGVKVPHTASLKGHSDADVGLHALTDALLGAVADGDIGQHFPPSDAKWRGAASDRFLEHAVSRVTGRGGKIVNLDVTLICERPKIGPHKDAMAQRVAEICQLTPNRVSVKATTTEKLGFTGRSEGIAAQAVATVRLPVRDEYGH
jgi:2-C-methyl-D-erythritol 4-phosphate cytidylyltransferase/2-C-methyl-D-erythritol 2,4-cyclodiphosphate synthase